MKLTSKVLYLGVLMSLAGNVFAACSTDCSSGCSTDCSTSCESSCNSCGSSNCSSCSTMCSTNCDNATCKPLFVPISQGENRARDYMSVTHLQNLEGQEDWNWYASLAVEYNQNWKRQDLGAYFFPNGTNTITVGVDGAPGVDVTNFELGLSPTFTGTLTIKPSIKNVVIEPAVYVGLDRWLEGAFVWFKVPIVHTRWEMNCCQTTSSSGGATFASLFVTSTVGETPAVGATSVEQAFAGVVYGDMQTKLTAGRILCCESSKTGVADLPLHLGYNFVRRENGYFGAYVRIVFPTGSSEKNRSIFQPIVGYNRWQLGAGLQGAIRLYEKDEDTSFHLVGDVYATHIFKKEQCRVFDLCANGCFSRYLTLVQVDSNNNYTGSLFHVVDKFTVKVESKFNWNVDGLAYFELRHKGWQADIGYEVQARAKETFGHCKTAEICNPCQSDSSCSSGCSTSSTELDGFSYGIKGTSNVVPVGTKFTATQSTSTIAKSGGVDASGPIFITESNFAGMLNYEKGRVPLAFVNKLWGGVSYTWSDRDYPVFAGLHGEVDFGNHNKALSTWGIRGKVGVAYN